MDLPTKPTGYRAYVLRCWEEQGHTIGQVGRWRFSLADPCTSVRHGFVSLTALVTFLKAELSGTGAALADDCGSDRPTDIT